MFLLFAVSGERLSNRDAIIYPFEPIKLFAVTALSIGKRFSSQIDRENTDTGSIAGRHTTAVEGTACAYQAGMDSKKTIMVVEDHVASRKLMAAVFGGATYNIIEVANGAEAIDCVRSSRPDLIIMDLLIPGLSADAVVQQLKADPATSRIPVIITTVCDPEDEIVKRTIEAGAEKVLFKPTPVRTVELEVRRLLSSS